MYKQNIQAVVNQGWGDFVLVYLVKHEGDKSFNGRADDKGWLVWEEVKEGTTTEQVKPLLNVPGFIWQDIVQAITDKTPPRSKERADGELEATKYHLQDLRKLLKIV